MNMKTTLVLEDESAVMRLLCLMLKHYNLVAATTAERVLSLFAGHVHQIDLFVADLTLPTSSGFSGKSR